jgi:Phasin protein
MAQRESRTGRAEKSSPSYPFISGFAEFAAIGSKRIDELANLQTELLNQLQTSNRQWFDRALSEANFASAFASRLTAARSIPEAMTACQEWVGRRLELLAEDGRNLSADAQRFMETGARLLSNGWLTNSGDST